MISGKSPGDLANLARSGASLEVNGQYLTPSDLGNIAGLLQEGAYLKIYKSDNFSADDLISIARRGKVVFA